MVKGTRWLMTEPDNQGKKQFLQGDTTNEITFAHSSERECAKILDFYKIKWQYEPRTFPIEWDKKGKAVQSFTPDFFLPEFDLYIELTTMSQKLVTKKNRKIRKLRELYPGIKVKIFYQKDFRNLLLKYGLQKKHERENKKEA